MLALGLGSFGDDDDFVIAMFVISCLEIVVSGIFVTIEHRLPL